MSDHTKHLDSLTLSMMVDDMLSQQESGKCHQHLSECKQCEQAYDDLVAMSFAMAKLPVVQPPADMVENIMSNLPPQDQVDSGKIIEIKEHHVKKDFFASLDMRQVACFAACVLLGGSFLMSPPELETADSVDGQGGVASDMLREMPQNEVDVGDGMGTFAEPEVGVVSSYPMGDEMEDEAMTELEQEPKEVEAIVEGEDSRSFLAPSGGLSVMSMKMFEDVFHDSFWETDPAPVVALFTNGYPEGTVLGDVYSKDQWVVSEEVPSLAYLRVTFSDELSEELRSYLLQEYAELEGRLKGSDSNELFFVYPIL